MQLATVNDRLSILAAVVYEITPKVFYNIENSSPFGDKDEGQFTLPKRLNHIMNYLSSAWITQRNSTKKKLKIKLKISPVDLSGLPNDLRDANPQDKQKLKLSLNLFACLLYFLYLYWYLSKRSGKFCCISFCLHYNQKETDKTQKHLEKLCRRTETDKYFQSMRINCWHIIAKEAQADDGSDSDSESVGVTNARQALTLRLRISKTCVLYVKEGGD